ncbi:hypothetical protein RIVM261_077870 [Rivularia sp. IAM M-261]|nr:hypothetical protein CAL7716_065540 [Calothrix sp. PCC 7716]GJD22831.1 hypothetical protein RIVM261_077870 [Rivularia sp. IAM M-261]
MSTILGLFGFVILFVLVVMGFDYVATHDIPVVTLAITTTGIVIAIGATTLSS